MSRSKILGGIALASTMLVALTGCPGFIANVVGTTESVDQAVDQADPGSTIKVQGDHEEDVDIETDNVTIVGENGATIDGEVEVKADNVTLENVEITEEAVIDGNNVAIANATIEGALDTVPGSFENLTLNNVTVEAWNATVSGTFTCTRVVQPGGNIQSAIDNSSSGDNVCVAPDTYTGTLLIDNDDNGLTLRSIGGAGNTIIEADLANEGGSPKLIIVDDANDVTIDGFTLRDSDPNTTANGTVHAVNVIARDSSSDDASGFTLTNSIVEDLNARDRVRSVGVTVQPGSGGASQGTADNPTITDNVFRNLVVDGDAAAGGGSGQAGNRVVAVGLNGSFSGADVSNNEFTDFSISPRSTQSQNKCIIHAVELSEDGNGDGPTDFAISDNTFDNFDSCENTVNGEDVSSVAIFVGGLNSLGNHEITGNNFNFDLGSAPTLGAGVDTLAGDEVDATNNWWGASNGPSSGGSGISPGRMNSSATGSGVLVSTNVDFSNFATSPF